MVRCRPMNIQPILAELRQEQSRISQAIAALESLGSTQNLQGIRRIGGASTGPRTVSLAARRRMARAQRARWRKVKSQAPASQSKPAPKRTVSASARRKIAAAQRARWAKVKKAA